MSQAQKLSPSLPPFGCLEKINPDAIENEVAERLNTDMIELILQFVNLFDGGFISSDKFRVRSRDSLEGLEPRLRLILNHIRELTLIIPHFRHLGTHQTLLEV